MTYMTVCLRSQSPLISPACQSQPDNGRDILSAQRDPPPHMTAIDSDFRRSSGPFPMRSRRISCPQLAARKSALTAVTRAGCLGKRRHRCVRDTVPSLNLSRGRASRSWSPDAASRHPAYLAWPRSRLPAFRLVQHGQEEAGMHRGYLRARHPEMGGGNVHHVQVVSSRVVQFRRQAAPGPYRATRFTTACETQRTLSLPERALSCGN
jgi:hypothetical protein